MLVKDGDIIEFVAISWNESNWEFDHPTVILKPYVRYSPNGESCEAMIEDMCIDICCDSELEDETIDSEFKFQAWKLTTLKKVVKNRFEGKDDWKSKIREVIKQKIQFYQKDDEMFFKILETIKK